MSAHRAPWVASALFGMLAVTQMHSTLGVTLTALAFAGWLAWNHDRDWLLAIVLVVPGGRGWCLARAAPPMPDTPAGP